jgi:hypothetical protein
MLAGLTPKISHVHVPKMMGISPDDFIKSYGATLLETNNNNVVSLVKLRRVADSSGIKLRPLAADVQAGWFKSI